MGLTTIAIPQDMKKELVMFGDKGESYADILGRLIQSAKKRQIQDLLLDREGTVPVKDALERAKKRWQK